MVAAYPLRSAMYPMPDCVALTHDIVEAFAHAERVSVEDGKPGAVFCRRLPSGA